MSHTDNDAPFAPQERIEHRTHVKLQAQRYIKSARRRIRMALHRARLEHEFDSGSVKEGHPLSHALRTI